MSSSSPAASRENTVGLEEATQVVKRMRKGGLLGPSEGKSWDELCPESMERTNRRQLTRPRGGGILGAKVGLPPGLPSLVGALGQVPAPLDASREWGDELYYEGLLPDGDEVHAQPPGD